MPKEEIITGIDIGSNNIRVVVGQKIAEEIKPHVVGVGSTPSSGIRRGTIVDIEEAVSGISTCLEQAERVSGIPIEHAYISVGGNHIVSQNSRGVIAVSRADKEISEEDITRAIDAASAISIPANQDVLHVVPRHFIVDSQKGIKDPVGMSGVRLEVDACIIEGSASFVKNLTKCVYRAGINIDDLVVSPLAAAGSILTNRQKELGVVLVDIGGGTTSLIVFEEGDMLHTAVLPIGAGHITNDLAIGLRTSVDVAEKIKLEYGSALPSEIEKREEIDLSKFSNVEEEIVSRRHVAEIIEARLSEIFSFVDKELHKIKRSGKLPAGCVLVGGGAKMPGIVDLAKEELKLPVQVGFPTGITASFDKMDDPAFAVAVGLVVWGASQQGQTSQGIKNVLSVGETVGRLKRWFKNFLP